jgi:hypothetical protein
MPKHLYPLIALFWFSLLPVWGQNITVSIKGKVVDPAQRPLERVNIMIKGTTIGTLTDSNGEFNLPPFSGRSVVIIFSSVGYQRIERKVSLSENPVIWLVMNPDVRKIQEIVIEKKRNKNNFQTIQPRLTDRLPSLGGSVETLIKTLPGVSSNNELSSQYSVRGGNFDENLVYVNGIEIIRPFLVKSGEQEGLSFINSDMVGSIGFSSGGFDASYGDKMSSVLDITYRKPDRNTATAEIGALGAAAHLEGSTTDGKFSHMTGIRYKYRLFTGNDG